LYSRSERDLHCFILCEHQLHLRVSLFSQLMETEVSSMSWHFSAPGKVDCCHGASQCCCRGRKVIGPKGDLSYSKRRAKISRSPIYHGCSGCRAERTSMQSTSTSAGEAGGVSSFFVEGVKAWHC